MARSSSSRSQNGFKTFIVYRRTDVSLAARYIYDRLNEEIGMGSVFFDVDVIPVGVDFARYLERSVASCKFVIAAIGPAWLDSRDEHGMRRIDQQHDFVRRELEFAVRNRVPLLPVLIDGAAMPRADELPPSISALTREQPILLRTEHIELDFQALKRRIADIVPGFWEAAEHKQVGFLRRLKQMLGRSAGGGAETPREQGPSDPLNDNEQFYGAAAGGTIFISYSRKNKDICRRIAKQLQNASIKVWMDELNIKVGDEWDDEIEAALKDCSALMIMLSKAAVESKNVKRELRYADDKDKQILPMLLEQCEIPLQIYGLHYIDLTRDFDANLRKCIKDLQGPFGTRASTAA